MLWALMLAAAGKEVTGSLHVVGFDLEAKQSVILLDIAVWIKTVGYSFS